jgi:hypothetical protein
LSIVDEAVGHLVATVTQVRAPGDAEPIVLAGSVLAHSEPIVLAGSVLARSEPIRSRVGKTLPNFGLRRT